MPTTRGRLQASFAAARPAPVLAAVPAPAHAERTADAPVGGGAGASVVPLLAALPGEGATTRDRIALRARASETRPGAEPRATPMAEVVDIAVARDARERRNADAARTEAAPAPSREPAVAEPVASSPGAARGPPQPEQAPIEPAGSARAAAIPAAPSTAAVEGVATPGAEAAAALDGAPAPTPASPSPTPSPPGEAATPAPEATAAPAPEVAIIRDPEDDPGFKAMKQRARAAAGTATTHQPPAEGAATAQAAAEPPANELESQAAVNQVEVMAEQEPGTFDAPAFVAAVKQAIDAATPQTLEDADEFKDSGVVGSATAQIDDLVAGGKEASASALETATAAEPNLTATVPKPVSEMVNDEPGPPLPDVGAADAMPGQRPAQHTDLSAGPAELDARMAAASVTEEQLANANEPQFSTALEARAALSEHAEAGPAAYLTQEQEILAAGRKDATGAAGGQLEAMHGARTGALDAALAAKEDTKSGDEAQRARVATDTEAIYAATKADVEAILGGLDTKVDDEFTKGEERARTAFEDYVGDHMAAYKADRYGGVGGTALWLKDAAFGMPDEVNDFYVQGRADYISAMDAVIERIAGIVGAELTAARTRIATGRQEIRAYVEALPASLQALGAEAETRLQSRFDGLESEVEAKQGELVDAVARRYVESRDALDARVEELKQANKGLFVAAIDFFAGVFDTVSSLSSMLLNVIGKAADVIGDIMAHPIRFLGNLCEGVAAGLNGFVERIGVHLQKSFVDWLFGALAQAGVTLPEKLDFAGILDVVLQVLGLTYANIRKRVALVVGEPLVADMEEHVELFTTLATVGVGGIWEWISERLSDLQDMVLGRIEEWVREQVVDGGIAWILGLLTPVGAFIKACQTIYDIIVFVVERASQIATFVDAVLDSIGAIAKDDISGAAQKVEAALADALPLAISFLAGLLGLGGITEKVTSIITTVRKPVERAVDAVVMGVAKAFKGESDAPPEAEAEPAVGKAKVGDEYLPPKTPMGAEYLQQAGTAKTVKEAEADYTSGASYNQQQALEPEPPPLVIDEDFTTDGVPHEVREAPGSDHLVVASAPTPITEVINPATGKKDPTLIGLHAEYVAARNAYDAALAARRANPKKRSFYTTHRRELKNVVRKIVAHIISIGLRLSPGASAPGIGESRRHGEKPPSLRFGPRIWWLESEHILPFAVGKQLWSAIGQVVPDRGDAADREQTTIMIYEGAADRKTEYHDKAMIASVKAVFAGGLLDLLKDRLRQAQWVDVNDPDTPQAQAYELVLNEVIDAVEDVAKTGVRVTNDEIEAEHDAKNPSGVTSGQLRGETEPLPSKNAVEAAAKQQLADILDLLTLAALRPPDKPRRIWKTKP